MDKIQIENNNLWHYTTLEGLKGIIESNCLWATDYRHLNDSSELNYARGVLQEELLQHLVHFVRGLRENNDRAKRYIDEEGGSEKVASDESRRIVDILWEALLEKTTMVVVPCILSFCVFERADENLQKNGLLSQWRGYGRDGGYSIVFNYKNILELFEKECKNFYYAIAEEGAVCYKSCALDAGSELYSHLQKITKFAHKFHNLNFTQSGSVPPDAEILQSLVHCLARFKHIGFEEEREYRFFVFAHRDEDVVRSCAEFTDYGKPFKKIHSRDRIGTSVPYVKLFEGEKSLPIEKIVVGPHRDKNKRVESLKVYLRSKGLNNIEVQASDIPYIGMNN
ncbi:MAG: DUF2971 domain-containing protein [Candidatus Omnitrophica bacterium]|nr:DUF2971 domain-containing protein [Candidatus Omnitrophota bacterium]